MNGHTRIVGASGSGKSTELVRRILADIENNKAVILIDPHGSNVDTVLSHFPKRSPIASDPSQYKRLVYLDPTDYPVAWNPLTSPGNPATLASSYLDTWRSIANFGVGSPFFDDCIYYSAAAMIENGGTVLGMVKMLTSGDYRTTIKVKDSVVSDFWDFFETLDPKSRAQHISSSVSRLRLFIADSRIRNCVCQTRESFCLEDIIKDKGVLLARFPIHKLGITKSRTLCQMLLGQVNATAMSVGKEISVYLDEAHFFAGNTFMEMLSGSRKYGVSLTFAHQYFRQFDEENLKAIEGNTETNIYYRLGYDDSQNLMRSMPPNNTIKEFHEFPRYTARTIGVSDNPDRCDPELMDPIGSEPSPTMRRNLLRVSRGLYGRNRAHVEREIAAFMTRY